MAGVPATREWVSSIISKSIAAATGESDQKPPRNLSGLNDVSINGPVNGEVLKFNNGSWYNTPDEKGTTVVANPSGEATTELKKLQVGNGIFSIPEGGGGGTVVEANPDASATDTLHKIKIGETVYKVPEGGGGSDPHQYSTVEQIVGTWIDGKDVYEVVSKEKPENCTVMNKITTEIIAGMGDNNEIEVVGVSNAGEIKGYSFNENVSVLYIGVQFNNKLQAVAVIDIVNNTIRQSTSDEITKAGELINLPANVDHHSGDSYNAVSEESYWFRWNNDGGYTDVTITLDKTNHTVKVNPGYSSVASSCFCNKINYYNIYTYIKN